MQLRCGPVCPGVDSEADLDQHRSLFVSLVLLLLVHKLLRYACTAPKPTTTMHDTSSSHYNHNKIKP